MKDVISAGEFKTHCLQIMNEVAEKKISVTLTKRGKPVAKLVPFDEGETSSGYGCLKGTIKFAGDIIGPFNEEWEEGF